MYSLTARGTGGGRGSHGDASFRPHLDHVTREKSALVTLKRIALEHPWLEDEITDEMVRLRDVEGLSYGDMVPLINDLVVRRDLAAKATWERSEARRKEMISDREARATLIPRDRWEAEFFATLDKTDAIRDETDAILRSAEEIRQQTEKAKRQTEAARQQTEEAKRQADEAKLLTEAARLRADAARTETHGLVGSAGVGREAERKRTEDELTKMDADREAARRSADDKFAREMAEQRARVAALEADADASDARAKATVDRTKKKWWPF